MIKVFETGVYYYQQQLIPAPEDKGHPETDRQKTMAYQILSTHQQGEMSQTLSLKFDSITSHDITYVGIIQSARASGMQQFPIPYVLTNCHNSLCAVGGSINEDDHKFALSAAQKYGGIYVPPNLAVIHTYNREMMTGVGKMILGSDSHTRYGALGTMGVGEGGGELVKQLIGQTYDIEYPEVIAIYLDNQPQPGIGPMDVALNLIKAVYARGYVKNKVMEFIGPGIAHLPIEFRNGVDVMTTETTCWSSIWETDEEVFDYYKTHKRPEAYAALKAQDGAYYDGAVYLDLSQVEASIALPFHPSNVYTIKELQQNPLPILHTVVDEAKQLFEGQIEKFHLLDKVVDGKIHVDQGIIAGCAGGTFDNILAAADILKGHSIGNETFSLNVYPGSQPVQLELMRNGALNELVQSGTIIRNAFCGPCFGAGDTPANNEFSIRHTTRNFPNREGSKPGEQQLSYVALMDAKSIAATALNHGILTAATELDVDYSEPAFHFNSKIYENRVLDRTLQPNTESPLVYGPNIKDWPQMEPLKEHLLLSLDSYILDAVTTTDELIPSGESSSYRSNPQRLAQLTLSRKDPQYVQRTKETKKFFETIDANHPLFNMIQTGETIDTEEVSFGSAIYAHKPGDGSAREQAASSQKVLGGWANLAQEYATKRYRSNLINWGLIPFIFNDYEQLELKSFVFVPHIKTALLSEQEEVRAYVLTKEKRTPINLSLGKLTAPERRVLVEGSLINYNRKILELKG